ncbi:MAG: repressor LexA [Candidatus Eisenbacteria sp.]|nr:repressor LexA [Candidatus Eisenbacteria bacterium]
MSEQGWQQGPGRTNKATRSDPGGITEELTPRQQEVLEVILGCVEQEGRFPSIREIASRLRLASPATVFQHMEALETKGCLRRRGRRWMLDPKVRRDQGIPIVGRVAAGSPLTAVEQIEGQLSADFLGLRKGRFGVRVVGDSMSGEGILEGDYAIVDPAATISNGDLVVAYLGEEQEVTIKRFFKHPWGIELRPANPRYETMRVCEGDPSLRMAGKVVGLMRRF